MTLLRTLGVPCCQNDHIVHLCVRISEQMFGFFTFSYLCVLAVKHVRRSEVNLQESSFFQRSTVRLGGKYLTH